MLTRDKRWASYAVAALALLIGGSAFAETPTPTGDQPGGSGLGQLLELVSSPTFPSLSGLIQPEKMGVLTDNQNNLSGNEVELEALSNNDVEILSDLQILSGITINVTIQFSSSETPAIKPKKADRPEKSGKPRPDGKPRKSKRR